MNSEPKSLGAPWRQRWRFSLAGLMVCTFGVAAGLAVTRIEGVRWFDGLLAAFAAWYLVGCWSQAAAIVRARRTNPGLRDSSAATWFAVTVRAIAPLLVALGAGLLIAKEIPAKSLRFNDSPPAEAFRFLCMALLVVPVMTTVDAPIRATTRRGGIGGLVTATLGSAAGILLAIVCIGNLLFITMLVHLAIHGVRQNHAIHPEGDYFSDVVFVSSSADVFATTAVTAAGTWCLAAGLLAAFSKAAAGSRRGLLFGAALTIALVAVGVLVILAGRLFYSQISPILADFIFTDKPSWLWCLGILVGWSAGCWLTQRLLRRGPELSGNPPALLPHRLAPYLHESLLVLLLPVAWWGLSEQESIRDLMESAWRLRGAALSWEEFCWAAAYFVLDIASLLMLAYGLAWLQTAWGRWKGYDPRGLELPSVSAGRLAAVGLGSLALLAAAAPVWAWLCFALWTWPTNLPGEAWLFLGR